MQRQAAVGRLVKIAVWTHCCLLNSRKGHQTSSQPLQAQKRSNGQLQLTSLTEGPADAELRRSLGDHLNSLGISTTAWLHGFGRESLGKPGLAIQRELGGANAVLYALELINFFPHEYNA